MSSYSKHKKETALFIASIFLIGLSHLMIFVVVPTEKLMGAVQRILYFHVSSAIACYFAFAGVLICGIGYLITKDLKFDFINEALAEVGFLFCTITLVSGMIWAKTAWGVWYRWEPRLVTFLLLWLIFLGFLFLRASTDFAQRAVQSSVVGILGACVVPLVWLSIKLLPESAQLHPQVIEKGGLQHPLFTLCYILSVVTMVVFGSFLVLLRTRIGLIELKFSQREGLR
jgi:heme exporter protein C